MTLLDLKLTGRRLAEDALSQTLEPLARAFPGIARRFRTRVSCSLLGGVCPHPVRIRIDEGHCAKIGFTHAQGSFFGRPVPIEQLERN
jgi:hypothetical protein